MKKEPMPNNIHILNSKLCGDSINDFRIDTKCSKISIRTSRDQASFQEPEGGDPTGTYSRGVGGNLRVLGHLKNRRQQMQKKTWEVTDLKKRPSRDVFVENNKIVGTKKKPKQ